MIWNMEKSGHIYKCQDNYEKICSQIFTTKEKINRTTKNRKTGIASRIFNRALQAMWETKLQMRQGKRTRSSLLSFYQRLWQEPYYDLRSSRIQSISGRELKQPSKNATNDRKNMRYQSQTFGQKNTFLENRSWCLTWYRPP
jgi:hypothetical protein